MEQKNIPLNEVTFGCLIDACVSCGHLKDALELMEK